MNENRFSPTFANILASLRVNGASVTGGAGKDGFVPVLGPDGLLDLSVIPVDALYGVVDVPVLPDAAFVDSGAEPMPGTEPTGSIAQPFRTMKAAAAKGFRNFILVGGSYGSDEVVWPVASNADVRVFSIGSSYFQHLAFSNYASDTRFEISNVSFGNLWFSHQGACGVTFVGPGTTNTLAATYENGSVSAFVDDTYTVVGTSGDVTTGYLANSGLVANRSTVAGATVSDALNKLAVRKIRIPVFASDENGLKVASTRDVEVGNNDIYALDGLEYGLGALVAAINGVFHKDGDDVTYGTVQATVKVSSPSVVAGSATAGSVRFGQETAVKAIVSVSQDNFLEVTTPEA